MSGAGAPIAGMGSSGNVPRVQFWEDFTVYELDSGSIAAAAVNNVNFLVQQDSAFKWMKSAYFADLAGAAVTSSARIVPLATVQIQDGGSGRNLFSAAVPVPSIFGTGDLPFILPIPRRFKPFSQVNATVTNFSAATTYSNIRLSLIGTKVFRGGPPPDMAWQY